MYESTDFCIMFAMNPDKCSMVWLMVSLLGGLEACLQMYATPGECIQQTSLVTCLVSTLRMLQSINGALSMKDTKRKRIV